MGSHLPLTVAHLAAALSGGWSLLASANHTKYPSTQGSEIAATTFRSSRSCRGPCAQIKRTTAARASETHTNMAVAIVLILGYISVACWSLLFVPQIVKNYRGSNAEGLSLLMCTMWAVSGFSVDAYYVRARPLYTQAFLKQHTDPIP